MKVSETRYLQLFDDAGAWIARPDYMVLAALSDTDPITIQHTYSAMLLEQKINPLSFDFQNSKFASKLKSDVIEKNIKERVLAGQVVLEMARIVAATQKAPTVNAARRLVAFKHHQHFAMGILATIKREVEKSFSRYRDTAHLQAAAVLNPLLLMEMEGDETACRKFLGIAKAFEEFIDSHVVSKSFKWSPYRVPSLIESFSAIKFFPISEQELKVALTS